LLKFGWFENYFYPLLNVHSVVPKVEFSAVFLTLPAFGAFSTRGLFRFSSAFAVNSAFLFLQSPQEFVLS
jgi:hypothetical protein